MPFLVLVLAAVVILCSMQVQGFSVTTNTCFSTIVSASCSSHSTSTSQHRFLASIRNLPLSGSSPLATTTTTTTTALYSLSSSSTSSSSDVRRVLDWIKDESLESLISKDETIAICRELAGDPALIDGVEQAVIENWDKIVQKSIATSEGNERRNTLSKLLGDEATRRLLRSVQNLDVYSDPKTVNAFLQSDAVNDLFAQTLYDGIYEFFQTIDVFGNIISNLPVLGPIRNRIRDDLKKQLDRTLGPSLRNFLKGYTNVAIGRASGFVLSDKNRKAFGKANARLLQSILDRPLKDLLPESSNPSIVKLRIEFFDYLRQLGNNEDSSDLEDYATLMYDLIGDNSLDSVGLDLHRVLDASPTLESTANRIFEDAIKNRES